MEKRDQDHIGKKIESLIKTLNMRKGDFANKAEISQSLISNIIAGKNGASKATINLICKTYNVNKDWLMTGQEPMFSYQSDDRKLSELDKELQEFVELYDRLIPETQKEIREYTREKYELQELKKQVANLQPADTKIGFHTSKPELTTYPKPEQGEEKEVHPIHNQERA